MGIKAMVITLAIVTGVTHFLFFGNPNAIVFDEVHFGKFISAYSTHEYYFDIHPPLGKLLIAGFGKLFDVNPEFSFPEIGQKFPDDGYKALRFLPTLAGALLPLVLFFLALELRLSREAAFALGLLVALDNALVAHSRLILLDPFLLLFGFSALWCYLRWRNGGTKWLLVGAGVLGGMAASIKWTGITFMGLIAVMEAIHLWQDLHGTARRRLIPILATLVIAPLAVYAGVFAVHFALLTKSGPGDAFMTAGFQKTLQGNPHNQDDIPTPNIIEKIIEINKEMYASNQRLDAEHPYSSVWYTWPIMFRPIFYWVDAGARIYFLGNPVVWWVSSAGVIALLLSLIAERKERTPVALMLMGGYFLNLLPFMGIKRVMFLYHYLTALIFAVIMLVYLISRTQNPRRNFIALVSLALVAFAYFAPLSYGVLMTPRSHDQRMWLKSWE